MKRREHRSGERLRAPLRVAVLAMGVLLFGCGVLIGLGAWLTMPSGEVHTYSVPAPMREDDPFVAYPWNEQLFSGTESTVEFEAGGLYFANELLQSVKFSNYIVREAGDFLHNEDFTVLGFRDMTVQVETYGGTAVWDEGEWEKYPSEWQLFSISIAVKYVTRADEWRPCFFSMQSVDPVQGADADAGFAQLCDLCETESGIQQLMQNAPGGGEHFRYLLPVDPNVLLADSCQALLQGDTVYFQYAEIATRITFLCDPYAQCLYGVSIEWL